MTTVQDGPSPTPPTIQQDQVEAAAEGEVVSKQEAPRCVQVDHPPSIIIGDINDRTTQSRSRNASHFAHLALSKIHAGP
jgi:type II secretory ATPase GspE/PulE/Tfp pilus assembly ATPase PilB-like protein